MGDATNKQLRTLIIISMLLSIVTLGVLLYSKKTIQLKSDSEGRLMTGDLKIHLKKPDVSIITGEKPKS